MAKAQELPDRNLGMELVRVTEAAAMAGARWMGRGDKEAADGAAVDAMRAVLSGVSMDGIVVIGEGEKDEAPMLYNGESIGDGHPPLVDIAVDPIDGTTLTSLGRPDAIDLTASGKANLKWVAKALRKDVADVTALIFDRPRHTEIIKECREAGARIRLIPDGDVAGAIMTAWPESGADILFGVGGTPEGVISACALNAWAAPSRAASGPGTSPSVRRPSTWGTTSTRS